MESSKKRKPKPETIEIGGTGCDGIKCRLIRSAKRRSVCIRIADDGVAEILIPLRMSAAQAREAGEKYKTWIVANREKRIELNTRRSEFVLKIGDRVRCLGGTRIITEHDSDTAGYTNEAFFVPRELDGEGLKYAVVKAYKLLAKDYINARTGEISDLMGLATTTVKINSAKSHWASYSKRGTVNFTWYSVMADPDALDYIIIHELCHMSEFNHSKRFWSLVARYCPDFENRKLYLRELWLEIISENWD